MSLNSDKCTSIEEWKSLVLARDSNRCVNCDDNDKVAVCFIIAPEAGGRLRVANGATVCRDCRTLADGARFLPVRIENKTPINFFISSELHKEVEQLVHTGSSFGSISALVRRQIASFIAEPELYEDLGLWQGHEGSQVKINGWANSVHYDLFKMMCKERDMSYTDAIKALLSMAVSSQSSDQHSS